MQGIVALLFALADLAEDAAAAPSHIRTRMLLVLRLAEPHARGIANNFGRPTVAACEDDSPAAALELARRLRLLACLLLASLTALQLDIPSGHLQAGAPGLMRRRLPLARPYLDTS